MTGLPNFIGKSGVHSQFFRKKCIFTHPLKGFVKILTLGKALLTDCFAQNADLILQNQASFILVHSFIVFANANLFAFALAYSYLCHLKLKRIIS